MENLSLEKYLRQKRERIVFSFLPFPFNDKNIPCKIMEINATKITMDQMQWRINNQLAMSLLNQWKANVGFRTREAKRYGCGETLFNPSFY
jgi:hypothetical protein